MKSWVGHSSEVVESASHSELGMLYMVQMNGMILLTWETEWESIINFPLIHPRKLFKTISDEEMIVTHVIE